MKQYEIGYYGLTTGLTSSSCSGVCSAGYYSNAGSIVCTSCSQGTYSSSGSSTCILCAKGSYGNSTGLSVCVNCPSGLIEYFI